ncbi:MULTISPECIES: LysR family transcriptional regulator [unclassified Variovorax]|jgi:DNA-binding transcriptional LysR family regulator|uniref:LysR family transcriptional regulator n=1 Tax=unclassified Variovorax TaxID=663243 RepID=UPI00089D9243|nr:MULTISPECIES: LysR family transcriptional regulator [unclassified Variovorax]SDZ23089.1 DNA-binding transcriptional regulator, LysR family [Variovorax sp. YR634]SEU16176.1 DNA-binding transcriptional regulator, LysR family [Variovorax sp. OV084]
MDSLDLIRTFREVASHGSFSQAAKRLDMSKATVSKYVAELETRFGVRLLNRSTRSVSLTDAGQLLLDRSTPMLEMVELTQSELQDRASQPGGRLRISAPHGMGSGEFPNLLADFMRYYPDVTISLQLTNRAVDLAEEGIDVELRSGPIEDANLIVRKLRLMNMVVCASPVYWKKHGKPEHPRDLSGHDALTFSAQGQQPAWRFDDNGTPIDVPVKSRMDCTEGAPLIRVAMHGFGVIYLPSILVQSHLDHGELVPVLQDYARKDVWFSAAYLQRRHNSAALRALLDFLQTRVGPGATARKPSHS